MPRGRGFVDFARFAALACLVRLALSEGEPGRVCAACYDAWEAPAAVPLIVAGIALGLVCALLATKRFR